MGGQDFIKEEKIRGQKWGLTENTEEHGDPQPLDLTIQRYLKLPELEMAPRRRSAPRRLLRWLSRSWAAALERGLDAGADGGGWAAGDGRRSPEYAGEDGNRGV